MPRIRLTAAPKGIILNTDSTLQPEGSARKLRNVASLSSNGQLRSAPPFVIVTGGSGSTLGRSRTKFNGRFINRGETTPGPVQRIERENPAGSNSYANLTLPVTPTVTLRSASPPMLFVTAPPTPEKDEHLFLLDTPNTTGDNALLKLNDAGTLSHWGILPPSPADTAGITAAAIVASGASAGQYEKYINTAAADPLENAADWTLATGDETALSADTVITTSANPAVDGNSIRFVVGKDDVAQITRIFAGNIDLTTLNGGAFNSGDEDFIQFWVRVRRPKHIQSLEIAFDTTAAGDFKTSFFSREVTFKLVGRKKRKKLIGTGDLVPFRRVKKFLQNQSKTNDLTFSAEQGQQVIPVAKNTWSRVTLPKNTFDQSGSPSWATVRAIRFTGHANKEGKTALFLDRLTLNGGPGMHGDYEYTITYTSENGNPSSAGSRSNPAIDDDAGTASGLRNSVISIKVPNVERQAVRLTFPALAFDPQVTRLEIWRTLGNGHAFFRCGYIAVSGGALGAGATFDDSCADYYGTASGSLKTVSGNNTSFAVLDPTVELPLDNTSPNDPAFSFQRVVDRPHMGRMWWGRNTTSTTETGTAQAALGTQGLVYYSPIGRMEAVQGFIYVTSGVTDPIEALVVWNDRLFVFTQSSVYEIVGTDEPFIAQKIEGAPGTLQPYTVSAGPAGIFYQGVDGIYKFNGQYAENITDASLLPLFKYRLNIETLVAPGTSLAALMVGVSAKNAYYLAGGAGFTFVYDYVPGAWRVLDAAQGPTTNNFNTGALYYDQTTGRLFCDSIAGGVDNTEIDATAYPTSGTQSFFTVKFFAWRSGPGRLAILRKLWVDVTRGDSGQGITVTPSVIIDGTTTNLTAFNPLNTGETTRSIQEYNLNMPGEVFEIEVTFSTCRNVRINAIEMDIYAPEQTDQENNA